MNGDFSRTWGTYSLVLISALIAAGLCRYYLTLGETPFEDAAMLLRYSLNFAEGHGIVWNVGSKPVAGATDFLPMVAVAFLIKAGLGPMAAVQSLGITCHVLTALIIFWTLRHLERAGLLAASLSALYFLAGPGLVLISAGFTTPAFAVVTAITWYLALNLILRTGTGAYELAFALSALGLGLIRPEGAILAVLMLLSIIFARGRSCFRLIVKFAVVFALFGGGYLLWHWRYFGDFMPLPFYRKGGWRLYPDSLTESVLGALGFAGPFVFAYLLGLRKPATMRLTLVFSIPIAGFVAIWLLISDEMNFMMRYQYPVLPIILMSWYPLVKSVGDEIQSSRLISFDGWQRGALLWAFQLVLCLYVLAKARQLDLGGEVAHNSNYDIAIALSRFDHRNTLAAAEAGIVPFYSGWRTIDTWGLNDPWIAKRGLIDRQYLDSSKPMVIEIEGPFNLASDDYHMGDQNGAWKAMATVLKCYARENHYILAAAFGATPYDTMTYYVRPGGESAAIVKMIRSIPVSDVSSGGKVPAIDFISQFTHDSGGGSDPASPTADQVPDKSVECDATSR